MLGCDPELYIQQIDGLISEDFGAQNTGSILITLENEFTVGGEKYRVPVGCLVAGKELTFFVE